jgi:hypothetical protein
MSHLAKHLWVRRSIVLSFAPVAIAFAVACSGETTAPAGDDPPAAARAIHILLDGRPAQAALEVGAFGAISFTVAEEDADGRLTPVAGRKVIWGSTYPAIMEAYEGVDNGYALVKRNGRARLIAELDGMRDTVALEIAQVAVAARVLVDTLVVLTEDAMNLGGGATGHDPFDFHVIRVDSNGYEVPSSEEISFAPTDDAPFSITSDGGGNLASLVGTRPGTGKLIVTLGNRSDTVHVQVTNTYRVVRLVEMPSGLLRVFPDTATIPAGAAVVFQNEASFVTSVDGARQAGQEWRAGPILVRGREAQIFTSPDVYSYAWGGEPRAVVVTP